jgi:hypothetical protein
MVLGYLRVPLLRKDKQAILRSMNEFLLSLPLAIHIRLKKEIKSSCPILNQNTFGYFLDLEGETGGTPDEHIDTN